MCWKGPIPTTTGSPDARRTAHEQSSIYMTRLRTLLVDDNETFLNSVTMLISSYPELEVVGLAHSAAEAIEQTELLHPHLVLMDMVMPGLNGIGGLEATTDY